MKLKKILGCVFSLGMLLSPLSVYAEDTDIVAHTSDNVNFTSINDAWSAARTGTEIYLDSDWNTTSRLVLEEGESATLDLNGHSISRVLSDYEGNGEVIYMNKKSSLTFNGSTNRTFEVSNLGDNSNKVNVTTGGVITGGKSKNGAGGIHMLENCSLTLNHVGVVGNRTSYFDDKGGGIQMNGDNCTVNLNDGSLVSYNLAYGGCGGGIYIAGEEGKVNINASEVSYNKANYGGGIYSNYDGTYIDLEDNGSINNNVASDNGGGVYFANSYNHIYSNDSTGKVSSNRIRDTKDTKEPSGGAIYYASSIKTNTGNVNGITFNGNEIDHSSGRGGALFFDLGKVEVTNCTFTKNSASLGGAVYLNDDNVSFSNCTFKQNSCKKNGGAVFVDSRYDFYISGKTIVKDNTNADGNAENVYLENGNFTRAYVSGTPDEGSEVGLTGDGSCKVGINQTSNNGSFFADNQNNYHLEYADGKLYQREGTTGSIFGNGNIVIASIALVVIVVGGCILYKKKKVN